MNGLWFDYVLWLRGKHDRCRVRLESNGCSYTGVMAGVSGSNGQRARYDTHLLRRLRRRNELRLLNYLLWQCGRLQLRYVELRNLLMNCHSRHLGSGHRT